MRRSFITSRLRDAGGVSGFFAKQFWEQIVDFQKCDKGEKKFKESKINVTYQVKVAKWLIQSGK